MAPQVPMVEAATAAPDTPDEMVVLGTTSQDDMDLPTVDDINLTGGQIPDRPALPPPRLAVL